MKYIALLRGINVGNKRIKIADLKTIFESIGHENVKTYLQSGNVIFDNTSNDDIKLAEDIEKKIKQTFGFSVDLIIRTEEEFKDIVNNNPFTKQENIEIDKLHVTFLKEAHNRPISKLDINRDENEKFKIIGNEIYLYLPNGYGRTNLTNNFFEKKLKVIATTRNWKTTNKLLELVKLE